MLLAPAIPVSWRHARRRARSGPRLSGALRAAHRVLASAACLSRLVPCWLAPLTVRRCREGRYNLAPIKFFATPPVHGSLAEVGAGWQR